MKYNFIRKSGIENLMNTSSRNKIVLFGLIIIIFSLFLTIIILNSYQASAQRNQSVTEASPDWIKIIGVSSIISAAVSGAINFFLTRHKIIEENKKTIFRI